MITVDRYDDAVDKQSYYSTIVDKLNDALLTIMELGDEAFDTEALEDAKSYADDKMREYRDLVDEIEKEERKGKSFGEWADDMFAKGTKSGMFAN